MAKNYRATSSYRDELGDITALKATGVGVSDNETEGTRDFSTLADLNDYVYTNVQLNHDRDQSSSIYPHIHFFQDNNNTPNFLVRYRWQTNGGTKTTAWSDSSRPALAFPYSAGTIHQIAYFSGLVPPSGTTISDIVQFRIFRDNANNSSVFAGTDPYTGTVNVLSFDVHILVDSNGSISEYVK